MTYDTPSPAGPVPPSLAVLHAELAEMVEALAAKGLPQAAARLEEVRWQMLREARRAIQDPGELLVIMLLMAEERQPGEALA